MAGLGGTTTRIVGNLAVNGFAEIAKGNRPEFKDLLLTPANISRLTDQLARMRGAAMKLGQLLSMDAGDVLPEELTEILSRLRAQADYMPPKQLKTVLNAAWGDGWLSKFQSFDVKPIAAASIGQVHRAVTKDGQEVAIKVQYPGVKRSIDSDVVSVGRLVKMSGLLPADLDLGPLLEEAKAQLHDEADYLREAEHLCRYATHLYGDGRFIVPELIPEFTTETVLAMTYTPGVPMDHLEHSDYDLRHRVVEALLELTLKELFSWKHMQTDPNFANYSFQPDTGRIVLLDFGAARAVPDWVSDGYLRLVISGLSNDVDGVSRESRALGFWSEDAPKSEQDQILSIMQFSFDMLKARGPFDFADPSPALEMRQRGLDLAQDMTHVHIPPVETLFVQRKFTGMYLLARKLRAKIDLNALLVPHVDRVSSSERFFLD
ncbi:MAG: AarF/ABC1/UbiB kinase family protein [Pseudomonadota bacterium]